MIPKFEEIRIENTNACVLDCAMCPRRQMTRTIGRMTFDAFVELCQRLNLSLRDSQLRSVDLHGFGEPLLDFELPKKIRYIHTLYPHLKTRIVTSMAYCTNIMMEELLESGLNEIVISHYATTESEYQKIHGRSGYKSTRKNINELIHRVISTKKSIHIVIESLRFGGFLQEEQELARQIRLKEWYNQFLSDGVSVRQFSNLHNWGSSFSFQNKSDRICSIVNGFRRRVLQITWEGNVVPCCFDYNSEIVFGNVFNSDLDTIFSSNKYEYFIDCHKRNEIELLTPCKNCQKCLIP